MRKLVVGWLLPVILLACAGEPTGKGTSSGGAGGSQTGSSSGAGTAPIVNPAAGTAAGGSAAGGASAGANAGAGVPGGGDEGGAAPGGDGGASSQLPAQHLDLASWKLTLPTGEAESPTEIKQPELASFELHPYFYFDPVAQAVVFQANAGGVTTSGSGYPRSELREMANAGADNAAWSMTSGVHTLTIRQAITHLPVVKPHVVAGQIHDAEDDVVMIRLEGEHLFVEGGGEELGELNPSYALGTEFTVRISALAGVIKIYYDDLATPKVEVPSEASDCYFKAGAYTQSSPEQGDEPTAYGEVAIYDLQVTHE